jgi:hypothetical protein
MLDMLNMLNTLNMLEALAVHRPHHRIIKWVLGRRPFNSFATKQCHQPLDNYLDL